MPILSIDTDFIGQTGISPKVILIYTTDDANTITGAGYLTKAAQSGVTFSEADMALVYGTDLVNSGPGCSFYAVQISDGQTSLVAQSGSGMVDSVLGTTDRITSSGGANPVINISPDYVGQTSLTTLGTISTGTWEGTAVAPAYGGTGVNNGSATLTIGGDFEMSGAATFTGTLTGDTAVTFPTSGTLATTGSIPSLPLSIANGGTAVTSVTTAPTASSWAGWDASSNLSANNLLEGYETTATAAATSTLTVASPYLQYFTGSTTQTVVLPVTSTLVLGQSFLIVNNSTGVVTVESSGTNTIQAMAAGTQLMVTCISLSGTSAASWHAQYSANVEGVQSVSGTSNIITSTGGVNPVIDISASYVGQNSITTLGTVGTGTWQGTTVGTSYGGTGVTSVTTAPTASAFAGWDSSKNLSANNFLSAYTTTATAASTTTLDVSSTYQQYFTGSTTQTVLLPVTSTLVLGQSYFIVNNSSGDVTVKSSGANTIQAMVANTTLLVTCISLSGTGAASWNAEYSAAGSSGVATVSGDGTTISTTGSSNVTVSIINTYAGQNTIDTVGTIGTGTWEGTVVAPAYGGTGVNNSSSTMTIGGNFAMSGAHSFTGTITGDTAVTFPTSGTLATTSQLPASPLPIANGGTDVTSVTTTPTANAFAGWDANENLSAVNFLEGYTTTVTAAGTTTLTAASTYIQYFTGSTTQTVVLPVTSTLSLGQSFYIVNKSSGAVAVHSSGGNTVQAVAAGAWALVTCILTSGTSAASWGVQYFTTGAGSGTITTVGDVGSGNAFDGSQGTTLTSTDAGFTFAVTGNSGGDGGGITMTTGATTSSGNAGGDFSLTAADGDGAGNGGAITLQAGNAPGAGLGGTVTILAGASAGGGAGQLDIEAGTNTNGDGGAVTFTSGSAGTTGNGGQMIISTGGGAGGGNGGELYLDVGQGGATGNGGILYMTSGQGGSTSGNGGQVLLYSGTSTVGTGGAITIQGGASASGVGGAILIQGTTSGGTNQAASTLTLAAGRGTGTGKPGQISIKGAASSLGSGTTTQTAVNRMVINGNIASMTSGTPSTLATLSLGNGKIAGGTVFYLVECSDGTNYQSVSGQFSYTVLEVSSTYSGQTTDGTFSTAANSGTLTATSGFSGTSLQLTATTSLTATELKVTFSIMNHSQGDITVA